MALKFFKLIEENKEISNLVTGFEFKLISMLGFRPQLKYCINCRSEECKFFSIDQGGLICSQCKDNNSYLLKINTEELNILNKILVSKFESILDMNISNKVKNLIRNYLMYHIDKHDFKSLKLLEEL
jgi:DNA repair protein RecO (recombination protein O)